MLPQTRRGIGRPESSRPSVRAHTPPRARLQPIALCAALSGASAAACGPATPPPVTASPGQVAGAAAITAVAAGTLWIVGGGCRLQGCPYGSYCNDQTGYCDVRKCEDGCPVDTVCNEGLGRCQAPPPPKAPNDFLPQDDPRLPPGTR